MTEPPQDATGGSTSEPTPSAVYRYLLYGVSLPERALRATTAVVSGTLRESAALVVPQAFRNSRSYSIFVQQMLDFLAHDVGGVERPLSQAADPAVENFVARKAVGSFLELAGLATLHVSPLTVLAIVSDVCYGSREFLLELSDELKKQGVIDANTSIDKTTDLLAAISRASGQTAEAFDAPPLSVDGMRETLEQTKDALKRIDVTKVLPQSEIKRLWQELHEVARSEHVGLLDVSTALSLFTIKRIGSLGEGALSTARVAGNMFDRHILEYYEQGLADIRQKGFYATLRESSRPYISAVWTNFASEKETVTQGLLSGRMLGRAWSSLRAYWNSGQDAPPDPPAGT
jgi:hypothetical protein